jgi:hypothetical protein
MTRMRMRPLGWMAPVWVMAVLLIVAGSTQQVRSSTATQEAPYQQTECVWFIKDTRMFCSSCKWRMSRSFPEHFAGRTFALLAEELLPGQAEGAVFQGDLSHPSRKVRHRNVPPSLFPFCQSACWSETIIHFAKISSGQARGELTEKRLVLCRQRCAQSTGTCRCTIASHHREQPR